MTHLVADIVALEAQIEALRRTVQFGCTVTEGGVGFSVQHGKTKDT